MDCDHSAYSSMCTMECARDAVVCGMKTATTLAVPVLPMVNTTAGAPRLHTNAG